MPRCWTWGDFALRTDGDSGTMSGSWGKILSPGTIRFKFISPLSCFVSDSWLVRSSMRASVCLPVPKLTPTFSLLTCMPFWERTSLPLMTSFVSESILTRPCVSLSMIRTAWFGLLEVLLLLIDLLRLFFFDLSSAMYTPFEILPLLTSDPRDLRSLGFVLFDFLVDGGEIFFLPTPWVVARRVPRSYSLKS